MTTMPAALPPLPFGGDYNPEQWPREVQIEDVDLMREAGVDLVTVGVFSWALLQPAPDRWDFGWLDAVMDRMDRAGIRVDLATATASPPPWLTRAHPEILPVTAAGTTLWQGGRQSYCPSSSLFREHALTLCRAMGQRYADHPALALWHVSNELGNHNARCHCDTSAEAFRGWLRARYADDVDRLNAAWGTAFWSQRYDDFEEVLPPRVAPNFPNPTQQLDFRRFCSDQLLDNFVAERDVLREVSPGVPVTTNFMVMSGVSEMDYFRWAAEVDVVSNDHYLLAHDPHPERELAFCGDLTRGVAGGAPWLLMEQSTSAVNWQPRNVAKAPGQLLRTSLGHVAHGSDGVLFFQWRASRAGAEKYHSALVPHAGTDTRVWREVVELSRALDAIEDVAGSRADNDVALLFDWHAWWSCELDSHPSADVTYWDRALDLHRALTAHGAGVDVVHPSEDLSGYRLVVVPTLYLVTDVNAANLARAVEAGASVLVTYFSGIVDEHDHVRLGGYPGAFRDLLGVRVEEFLPLRDGEKVRLADGHSADTWTEDLALAGAEEVVSYLDGPAAGRPAVTRRTVGDAAAWYVATRLSPEGTDALVGRILDEAGVRRVGPGGPHLECVRRVGGEGRSWLFVLNHGAEAVRVRASGRELTTGSRVDGYLDVAAGGVAVVEEA
jgi:beta-galactosidase